MSVSSVYDTAYSLIARPRIRSVENTSSQINIHTYIYTYIHTYIVHTYILSYLHTYLHTYIRTYLHIYILIYLLTYLLTYILTYYILICLHTYIHTYIHTYLQNIHILSRTFYSRIKTWNPLLYFVVDFYSQFHFHFIILWRNVVIYIVFNACV